MGNGLELRLEIAHCDQIYNYFKDQALWRVLELWTEYFIYHSSIVEHEEAWYDCAEELVQSRHFIMGLTAVLKYKNSWDYSKCRPANSCFDDML